MTSKIRKYDDFIYFFIDQTPAKSIQDNTNFISWGEAAPTEIYSLKIYISAQFSADAYLKVLWSDSKCTNACRIKI